MPSASRPRMAPERKKQRKSSGGAATQAMVHGINTPAVQRLPPDILQMIFGHIACVDLIRCMRVCRTWNRYLPGNDPKLHEALFVSCKQQPTKELIRLDFSISIRGAIGRRWREDLPRVTYYITLNFMPPRDRKVSLHPAICWTPRYVHIFNTHLRHTIEFSPFAIKAIAFTSMDELEEKTRLNENHIRDGTWNDSLVCVPAANKVQVNFTNFDDSNTETHVLTDSRGVRLQTLVQLMRENLQQAHTKAKSFISATDIIDYHWRMGVNGTILKNKSVPEVFESPGTGLIRIMRIANGDEPAEVPRSN
jgi:hypothetical protein